MRDRGFGSGALRSAGPHLSTNVSVLRDELRRIRATLAVDVPADAQIALRVFVASKHSHTFTSRFDTIRADGIVSLRDAGRAVLEVTTELETLISSGSVRLSAFAEVLDRLRSAVGVLSVERIREELGVVRTNPPKQSLVDA